VQGTHKKQAWVWHCWNEHTLSIRIREDIFRENFSQEQQHSIIGAFTMAVREGRFSKGAHEQLAAGTVGGTVQYVSATFRENGYPNPTLDKDGVLVWILQQEFWSFIDPAETSSSNPQHRRHSNQQVKQLRTQKSNRPTCLPCHLLCNEIL
jgi:hypothetical protein